MPDDSAQNDLRETLASLKPESKKPVNKRVLDSWISKIENSMPEERSGRLVWLVASTVVTGCCY